MKILLCGLGYTTNYLLENFKNYQYKILSRKKDSLEKTLVYEPFFDEFFPDIVVDSIPPVFKENELINPIYKEILLNIYKKKKFVYVHISSTSIYPEENKVFTEISEIPYFIERGRIRWELEEKILKYFPYALIIRAGGIYGPNRNLLISLKNKDYSHLPEVNKIVYRIHIFDLCQIILNASKKLLQSNIETSVFAGYKRNNLIIAIEKENFYIKEVLDFISSNFGIQVEIQLKETTTIRKLKSLYTENLIQFKYPNVFLGIQAYFKKGSDVF